MSGKPAFTSLRAEIRHIADGAGKVLLATEIFAQITRKNVNWVTMNVTLVQMCEAQQLVKAPVTKIRARGTRARFAYGPGPVAVDDAKEYRPERARLKGFRELAREADARARGRG